MDWHTAGRKWLQDCADKAYLHWLASKQGKRYKNSRKTRSPHMCGFSLPEWHHRAINALNANDEETFKSIKMIESMY